MHASNPTGFAALLAPDRRCARHLKATIYILIMKTLQPEEFPSRLRQIPDPPKRLYIEGELPTDECKFLAVVGARRFTPYGKEVCEKLIEGLRGHSIIIVSGLALGIDGIAHRAALAANLKTLAVPGSGLGRDVLYPSAHKNLAEKILASGGCLLSEFEPDFRATTYSFPLRNRIMAGLSDAVLIIEAEKKSGTLITSRLAADYNRDVLTVPGSIYAKNSEGPHLLLRLGATPITCSNDILEALHIPTVENTESSATKYSDCSADELKVVELLSSPLPRSTLIEKLGLPTSTVNIVLSVMELKGLVEESLGEIRLK